MKCFVGCWVLVKWLLGGVGCLMLGVDEMLCWVLAV